MFQAESNFFSSLFFFFFFFFFWDDHDRDKTVATKELAYKIQLKGPRNLATVGDLCWSKLKSQAFVLGYRHFEDPPPVFDDGAGSDLKKSFEKLQAINANAPNLQYDPSGANVTRIWKDYCTKPAT